MDNKKLELVTDIIKEIISESTIEAEKAKAENKQFRLRFGVVPRLNPKSRMIFRGAFPDETLAKFCSRMAEEGKLLKDFVGYKPNLSKATEINRENGFIHYKVVFNDQESIVKINEKTGYAMTPIYYLSEFVPDWIKNKISAKETTKLAMMMGQEWYKNHVQNTEEVIL